MDPLSIAPAAFLAGILMFLAPCTLPIVPGYLAFIAGVPAGGAMAGPARRRLLVNSIAFVVGFTLVFMLLGTFAATLGAFLGPWRDLLGRVAGLLLIFFGLVMFGARVPGLSGEWHARLPRSLQLGSPQSSFLVGLLFAIGWSPCIGPILGTVLFFASASATAAQGTLLLFIFSLGMGLPFILVALLMEKASLSLSNMGKLTKVLSLVGALLLIVIGALMLTGTIGYLSTWLQSALGFLHYDRLLNYL